MAKRTFRDQYKQCWQDGAAEVDVLKYDPEIDIDEDTRKSVRYIRCHNGKNKWRYCSSKNCPLIKEASDETQ